MVNLAVVVEDILLQVNQVLHPYQLEVMVVQEQQMI